MRTAASGETMVVMSAMVNRNSGRDSAHADEAAACQKHAGVDAIDEDAMELDWENDDDDDSWGLMDQADQEAIEEELDAVSSEYKSSSDSSGGEQEGEGEHPQVARNESAKDVRAQSPVARQDHHRSDNHRFIITPEQKSVTLFEIVVTAQEDGCWEEEDDDEIEDGHPQLPLDRLSQLMRRSDQSRRSLQKESLPTKFYGSSRFFNIELERQYLRRMLDD